MLKWLLLFFICLPAWAYRLTSDFTNGFYWASLPVNFVVVDNDPQRKQLLTDLASQAIEEWESRTGLELWNLSAGGGSNIIRWSNNFAAETNMDPVSVLAVAIRFTEGPYFAKSEIVINGGHESFNTPFKGVNKMNLGTTLVHELGHTMGLDHSENMAAVMAPTLQYPYNGLHQDDIHGMTDAHQQTDNRQVTRYVSPLAYKIESRSNQPLSCGTTAHASSLTAGNSILSLAGGILITFIRKLLSWFKSLF